FGEPGQRNPRDSACGKEALFEPAAAKSLPFHDCERCGSRNSRTGESQGAHPTVTATRPPDAVTQMLIEALRKVILQADVQSGLQSIRPHNRSGTVFVQVQAGRRTAGDS